MEVCRNVWMPELYRSPLLVLTCPVKSRDQTRTISEVKKRQVIDGTLYSASLHTSVDKAAVNFAKTTSQSAADRCIDNASVNLSLGRCTSARQQETGQQ